MYLINSDTQFCPNNVLELDINQATLLKVNTSDLQLRLKDFEPFSCFTTVSLQQKRSGNGLLSSGTLYSSCHVSFEII